MRRIIGLLLLLALISSARGQTATARYWYDNDETTVQMTSTVKGMIDLDISHLNIGVHAIHYQTFNSGGEASPVRTQYFYMNELQPATLSCQIWIDDNEVGAQTFPLTDDDIVIDAEDLTIGMHNLHVALFDANGQWLAQEETSFEVKEPTVTITLTKAMSTFCSDKDVDFTDTPTLKAYIATGFNRQSGDVLLCRVYDVPKYTGVVLKGEANTTYEVPCRESFAYYSNLMIGTTSVVYPEPEDGFTDYILSNGVFIRLSTGGKVNAGKAYLHVPSRVATARQLNIIFEDEDGTTGIDAVRNSESTSLDEIYNLNGQRVNQPRKGLYIKNGKKVIIK